MQENKFINIILKEVVGKLNNETLKNHTDNINLFNTNMVFAK